MAVKQVGVELTADGASQFERDIDNANKSVTNFGRDAEKASGGLGKFGAGLLDVAKVAGGMLLADLASKGFGALSGAIQGGIADAREANLIFAQSEAAIKATGGAAGVSAQHVSDYAASLSAASGASLFGDSQIAESTNLLLTFKEIKGATLDAATAISVDMAQAMGGAPKDAAIQLGKALNDPIAGVSALSRVGVTFNDQQKEQIATMVAAGDVAGAQAVILKELSGEFGGSAAAAAVADGGVAQFKDRMGELGESIGAQVLPMLNGLMAWLNSPEVTGAIERIVNGLVAGFSAIGTAIGPVLAWVADLGKALIFQDEWSSSWAETLTTLGGEILAKLGDIGASILTWITAQAPLWAAQLLTWGQALADWIAPYIPIVLGKLGEMAASLWGWVQEQAPVLLAQLAAWGKSLVAWIAPQIPGLLEEAKALGKRFIGWIGDQAAPILKKLGDWGESLVAWIVPATKDFLAKWPIMFDQFLDWIGAQAGPLLKKLGDWAVSFVAWILPMIPPILAALAGVAAAIVVWLGETAWVLLEKMRTDWIPAFYKWVAEVWPKLQAALIDMRDQIKVWLDGANTWMRGKAAEIGDALVAGIRNGVASAWGSFIGWINSQIAKIPKAIRDFLGINSPSRVMAEQVGQWIPAGIAQGIAANMGVVDAALARLTGGMGADISVSGSGRIAPPASASQMMAASYSTVNAPVNYNWSPTYHNADRSPSQDFHIMQALSR